MSRYYECFKCKGVYANATLCPACDAYVKPEPDKCGTCGESHGAMDYCRGVKYGNPVLNERESTHGDYADTARIAQKLKAAIEHNGKFIHMPEMHRESLHMICTKLARIMSGNHNDPDHWKDLAGYANLISERLK